MSSYSKKITIRLFRKENQDHKNNDDIIDIEWKGKDTYHVYYLDGSDPDRTYRHMTVLKGEQLDTYITCLFTLVSNDDEPFSSIQFLIPCFPSVLFTAEQLKRRCIRSALMDIMSLCCWADYV
jgi:hypothetical protein